jgi:hypothetical protein
VKARGLLTDERFCRASIPLITEQLRLPAVKHSGGAPYAWPRR